MKQRLALATVLTAILLPGTSARAEQELPAPVPPKPAAPAPPRGPVEVNGIAATVNGRVVTKNQVSMLLGPVYAQLVAQFPRRGPLFDSKFKESKTKIIQELIDRQIILEEFKSIGGSIKPFIIEEELKRQMRELYNGDEGKFREELKRNRLTMEGYREMTREKLVVQAMRARQFSDSEPPLPNEIEKEYAVMKLSLRDMSKDVITFQKIFIPASDPENPVATPDTQLSIAEGLAKQIADGKDFTELAKANSKDAFADKGGLQEKVPRTDLSAEFAAIIFDAEADKIIGPLMDPQGFTIVKVIKIDYGPSPSLGDDKVRQLIEDQVRRKKTSAQYERWIESRRKKAIIDIRM